MYHEKRTGDTNNTTQAKGSHPERDDGSSVGILTQSLTYF